MSEESKKKKFVAYCRQKIGSDEILKELNIEQKLFKCDQMTLADLYFIDENTLT